MVNVVEALVQGGAANPGPPLGPALGPLGVNIKAVIDKVNAETAAFKGMQVPVKIIVEDNKQFRIEIGTPPTSALILKELGLEKGSGKPNTETVGDLKIQQAIKIAKMKKNETLAKTLKNGVKEVIGSCLPLGITVEGMKAKDAGKAVSEGKFDAVLVAESA